MATKMKYSVKTENISAESGAAFLLDQLEDYNLSIFHETLIQNVCEAIQDNTRRGMEKSTSKALIYQSNGIAYTDRNDEKE